MYKRQAYTNALSQPLVWGWGAHTPMELYNIYHTAEESGSAQYSPYSNETVDVYMDEALAADSLEESYELWQKAQWDGSTGVTQEGDIPWAVSYTHLDVYKRQSEETAHESVDICRHTPDSNFWTVP